MEKESDPQLGLDNPANDNGRSVSVPLDPRILRIAEAIGRQLAREHAKMRRSAANDNEPRR
jgi:hypothetical protein